MTLVDTSVWIEHLRVGVPDLARLLNRGQVLSHPMIVGELAMGNLRDRTRVLTSLDDLPAATTATDAEVRGLVERKGLHGLGIGFVDAHLLAATQLTGSATIWTLDRRLARVAEGLGLASKTLPH